MDGNFEESEDTRNVTHAEGKCKNGQNELNSRVWGRGRHALKPELVAALERLRKGQEWLIVMWLNIRDQDDWGDDKEAYEKSYDAWDLLEIEVRSKYGYRECVIGPEGCDEDAPIRCDFCAGRVNPQPTIFVCERPGRQTSTKVDQGALFNMGRRPD